MAETLKTGEEAAGNKASQRRVAAHGDFSAAKQGAFHHNICWHGRTLVTEIALAGGLGNVC